MGRAPQGRISHAGALVTILVGTLVSGCVVEIPLPDAPTVAGRPFQLWMTDAQAPLKSLELSVTKVFVGKNQLKVHEPTFDLLEHNGIAEGFLLASGRVSSDEPEEIKILFDGAVADLGGTVVNLALPLDVLVFTPDQLMGDAGHALLLDINATESLQFDGSTLSFVPQVDAAFIASLGPTTGGASAAEPVFQPEATIAYEQYHLISVPAGLVVSEDGQVGRTVANLTAPAQDVLETVAGSTLPVADVTVRDLDPDADVKGWFVHFSEGLDEEEKAITVEAHGGSLVFLFETIHAGYALARDDQAWAMSQSPHITYVEADRPVEFLLRTSRAAIQIPALSDPILGIKDPSGNPIDGRGVGLAVVDIGIDGTHPDLRHWSLAAAGPTALKVNYKVESLFTADVPTTDDASGHGTHVAGIAAGRGILDPTQKGVAPGAAVYAFGVGEADTTLWTNQALDWIAQNHNHVDPPIRVVTNSWTTSATYDPNSAVTKLVNNLVAKGVVVVFAAGNRGGDGTTATTTGECQIPTAGVICVAATDDLELGSRDGPVASYSSRGSVARPATWPDLSAPGTKIRSTAPILGVATPLALQGYAELKGTSMAAPHVAGVAALMLQARPGLTPPQVESLMESSAYKFADGGGYAATGSHYSKGHGLVDAYAAVSATKLS